MSRMFTPLGSPGRAGWLAGCVVLSQGLPLCATANLSWKLGLIICSGLLGGANKVMHLKLGL